MFVVSHVNILHIHTSTYPNNDYWCGLSLSVVLERTVRFLTTVDVVLEEYNNCLPNNKWLSVKHVSIVFGQTYVNGALLMIISTSNNTVCSSSKWLQKKKHKKKQVIAKKNGAGAPRAASEFVSAFSERLVCIKHLIFSITFNITCLAF